MIFKGTCLPTEYHPLYGIIKRLFQYPHHIWFFHKTFWLLDIYITVEICIKISCVEIHVMNNHLFLYSFLNHHSESSLAGSRCECLQIVNFMYLKVAFCDISGLVLFFTIRAKFIGKNPATTNNRLVIRQRNQFICVIVS